MQIRQKVPLDVVKKLYYPLLRIQRCQREEDSDAITALTVFILPAKPISI